MMLRSGDSMNKKMKEEIGDGRRRICLLDLMGFHLQEDELMVKLKAGKKSLTDHVSFFC